MLTIIFDFSTCSFKMLVCCYIVNGVYFSECVPSIGVKGKMCKRTPDRRGGAGGKADSLLTVRMELRWHGATSLQLAFKLFVCFMLQFKFVWFNKLQLLFGTSTSLSGSIHATLHASDYCINTSHSSQETRDKIGNLF